MPRLERLVYSPNPHHWRPGRCLDVELNLVRPGSAADRARDLTDSRPFVGNGVA
jgi:hypothetical protein